MRCISDMGSRNFCDNCNADETPDLPVYKAKFELRSLPGNKIGGVRVGTPGRMDKDKINKELARAKAEDREDDIHPDWKEVEYQPPSDIYYFGTRDLCLTCIKSV